jgi:wyosine [tRNA(Phe)-imidazoG37] synthetase (radical SAM superfamily)
VAAPLRRVADVAFAGDGEPTTPREFATAARVAREALDRASLHVPLRLLTNATLFDRPRVREALGLFDELWCKLDAGTEEHFRLASGAKIPLSKVLANLRDVARERPIVIQSLFFSFGGTPPAELEIGAWATALASIEAAGGRIDRVQVYTVARRPSDLRVGPLDDEHLQAIANSVRQKGMRVEVHGEA